ncbi:MAG: CARDB domain-containing protein [Myxococcota bacterium]
MNGTKLLGATLLAAAVWGGLAQAQVYTVSSPTAQAYVPLTGGTNVTLSDPDEGSATIALPFNFPFYGQTYNSVTIHANGFITLPPSACTSFCFSNRSLPSTSGVFHSVVAPWWEDLEGLKTTAQVRWAAPTAGELVIEWFDWSYFVTSSSSMSFQVKLTSSGLIQFHYGTHTGGTPAAAVGFENQTGSQGAAVLSCSPTCGQGSWPTNQIITIGQPVQPDLALDSVGLSNMVSGSSLTFTVSPVFRNFGQNPANNFLWRAYLSTDRVLDGADVLAFTATTPVSVAATSTASASGNASTPLPPPGQYYVLVQADHTNVVTEASESNNVGSTANYFTQGVDLVATSVSGPALSGPGSNITVNVKWFNQGTSAPSGPVEFKIWLSSNNTLETSDYVLYGATRAVTGGQTFDENVTFTVPQNVLGGTLYYLLQVDSAGSVTEASETNNVAVSAAQVTMQQADLEIELVDVLDPVTGAPTRVGHFGQVGRLSVTFRNIGGATANNFRIGVAISADNNLSLLSDTIAHDEPVAQVAAGGATTVTFSYTVPLKDRTNKDFVTGNYYLFAILDSFGEVAELSESNNSLSLGPVLLRAPAQDYTVTRVEAPSSGAVGEAMPVFRTFKNIGNVDGEAVAYRFYASANDIITPDDVPLAIVGANGSTSESGTVTLAVGAESTTTELVKLPPTMPPGTYYIGAIVDSGNAAAELDETNNGGASISTVQVAPSSLRITTQQLPDGVIDRPYSFRLVAAGAQGPLAWSVDTATGSLPAGLTMSNDGLVSGTPTAASVSAFTAVVTAGATSAAARLVIRVLPTTTQLEITTASLPPVINSPTVPYQASLGAAGGVKPYVWSVVSGALPNGITMDAEGVFVGAVRAGVAVGETRVVFQVQDGVGSVGQKELKVRVVEPSALVIRTLAVPDSLVNSDYLSDLQAQNADGSPLAKPLVWTVAAGTLPDGLELVTQDDERGILQGKPLVAGTYSFSLQVEDSKGRIDVADFLLRVFPVRFRLAAVNPPAALHPGDEVSFAIAAVGAASPRFKLYAGPLPKGLTLDEQGNVSGAVADEDGVVGVYNFVVEASDGAGATGLGAFTLEVVESPPRGGCATAPGKGGWLWWLLLMPMLWLLRRRKVPAQAIAAVVLGLLPFTASAQLTYQVQGPVASAWQPISGGTNLSAVNPFSGQAVTLPFPVKFYDQMHTSVTVSALGFLVFAGDPTEWINAGIPSSSTTGPTSFIAAWWDDLDDTAGTRCAAGQTCISYKVTGAAPNRAVTFEWRDVVYYGSTTKFSFQITLFEADGKIRFNYGPTAPSSASASVGVQKVAGTGVAALTCTTPSSGACAISSFPVNQAIDLVLPADLTVSSLSGDSIGYAGATYRASATLKNVGGRTATGATVRFYLSVNNTWEAGDPVLGDSTPIDVGPGGEQLVSASGPIPPSTAPGSYFLLARADPDGLWAELDENNNSFAPRQFTVAPPTPDLAVSSISGPTQAVPGQTIAVPRVLTNAGSAAVSAPFKYTVFLSDNSVVTVSDRALFTGTVAGLAANASDTQTDSVALPNDLTAGRFWLGVCVDHDPAGNPVSTVQEISEVNNCVTATGGVVVSTGALAIITQSIPGATQFAPYGLTLQAAGGNGTYAWALNAGALPPGLLLGANGTLTGTPSEAGSYGFEVKVTSAADTATAQFSLTVTPAKLPLAIVDQELPTAEFSRSYTATLVAVGGKPPYVWRLAADSRLPVGLALSSDGTVEGRPGESGEIPFRVELTDEAGTQAAKDLRIRVVTPGRMQIATTRLATAYLNKDYSQALQALSGRPPYDWSVVKFQRLAENPTEAPGPAETGLPPSFGLAIEEDASGQDLLRGVPTRAGLYAVTLRVQDATGTEDITTLPLHVSYEEALAITTTALPDAFVGQPYAARLSHNGGAAVTDAVFTVPCVKQADPNLTDFGCAAVDLTQSLPGGLTLDPQGQLSGVPTAPPAAVGKDGKAGPVVFSFLVRVTDGAGRQDVRGLSIKVRPDFVPAGGCSGTALGPSLLGLLAGALATWRGRRRR